METIFLTDNTLCPFCKSDDTDIQEELYEQPLFHVQWGCEDCGEVWTNTYAYSSTEIYIDD